MMEKTWDDGGMTEKTRDDREDARWRRRRKMTEKTQDDSGMMCQVEEQELKGWTMFPDAIVPPSKEDLLEWFYRC